MNVKNLCSLIVVVAACFLLTGYKTITEFPLNAILITSLYIIGVAGLLLIYRSRKHLEPKKAWICLMLGLFLLCSSYFSLVLSLALNLP